MKASQELRMAYETLRKNHPNLYLRDAAEQLGVSEMELLRLETGQGVTRLRPEIPALLEALPTLGPLKALSRNRWVVIETTGAYPSPFVERGTMVFASSIIDLRIYLSAWKYAFAVKSFGKDGKPLYSFQFFTEWGEAIHKVYLTASEQIEKWEHLVQRFSHENQSPEADNIAPVPSLPKSSPLENHSKVAFLEGWNNLTDTHEFFGLLRAFGVDRLTAIEAAAGLHTWQLPNNALHSLLEWARDSQTPIMFFVGNAGIHHIYSGTIKNVSLARGWLNVLDPDFNIHINPEGINRIYLVRKPTKEGDIYSLEVFGPAGEELLWIFGARKPGLPVPESWRSYVHGLIPSIAH
ncbi:MAG: hemin-degrading factor [Bacteroidia bacterium]|nr:hemin-degrading factor [Bacteroidia bacterium]MCX7652966.1 hemin-degrading factor [Bacteroidia bacterium]MDW8417471.1 ChuX/HutX family heme-like substrate-binding protein [Bacteroidia bacterium]